MEKIARNTSQKSKKVEQQSYMGIGKGVVGACLFTIIVFVVMAFVLTYTDVSEGIIAAASVLITAVAAIIAGFFAAKSAKNRGLLWGMAAGIIYVLIVFVVLFTSQDGMTFSLGKITGVLCAAAGGGIGGILGINTKK